MTVIEKNGVRVLTLETEHLDALNSEEIKKLMIDNVDGAEKVVLNMDSITFVDSSGLGVILTVFRHVKDSEGKLVISCVKDSVKVLFKLVRLSHMIQVFDTESEAISQV
jgi:anti-sigma B factor antagonist